MEPIFGSWSKATAGGRSKGRETIQSDFIDSDTMYGNGITTGNWLGWKADKKADCQANKVNICTDNETMEATFGSYNKNKIGTTPGSQIAKDKGRINAGVRYSKTHDGKTLRTISKGKEEVDIRFGSDNKFRDKFKAIKSMRQSRSSMEKRSGIENDLKNDLGKTKRDNELNYNARHFVTGGLPTTKTTDVGYETVKHCIDVANYTENTHKSDKLQYKLKYNPGVEKQETENIKEQKVADKGCRLEEEHHVEEPDLLWDVSNDWMVRYFLTKDDIDFTISSN